MAMIYSTSKINCLIYSPIINGPFKYIKHRHTTMSQVFVHCLSLWADTCKPWTSHCAQQTKVFAASIVIITWVWGCKRRQSQYVCI